MAGTVDESRAGDANSEERQARVRAPGNGADVLSPVARRALEQVVGSLEVIEPISGVGGPGVFFCRGARQASVLKYPAPVEVTFYKSWAQELAGRGQVIPALLAAGQDGDRPFLVLEWLPRSVDEAPEGSRPSDAVLREKIRYLAGIHQTKRPAIVPAAQTLPARTGAVPEDDLRDALALFASAEQRRLGELLALPWPRVQGASLLSGDPNRTNWGRREDGTLALFDWGQAGFGHPAYDLAILEGGLVGVPSLRRVVHAYLKLGTDGESADRWLAMAITARLATFLSFLANWRRGELVPEARPGADMLRGGILPWLAAARPHAAPYGEEPMARL